MHTVTVRLKAKTQSLNILGKTRANVSTPVSLGTLRKVIFNTQKVALLYVCSTTYTLGTL